MNATTEPMMSICKLLPCARIELSPWLMSLYVSRHVAPNIVGTARKNENSAAALRVSFCDNTTAQDITALLAGLDEGLATLQRR